MKIAIPTNNKKGLNASVAEHFGRARNFLIYDTKTKISSIYSNPEVTGGSELPPDFLYRQDVKVVIVFSLGAMAYKKFKSYNIKMYKAVSGSILKNIKKFKEGSLKELKEEDIF